MKCKINRCKGINIKLKRCGLCSKLQYCRHHIERLSNVEVELYYVHTVLNWLFQNMKEGSKKGKIHTTMV